MEGIRILKGDIIYSKSQDELVTMKDGFLVTKKYTILGVYQVLPI